MCEDYNRGKMQGSTICISKIFLTCHDIHTKSGYTCITKYQGEKKKKRKKKKTI